MAQLTSWHNEPVAAHPGLPWLRSLSSRRVPLVSPAAARIGPILVVAVVVAVRRIDGGGSVPWPCKRPVGPRRCSLPRAPSLAWHALRSQQACACWGWSS